MCGSMLDLSPYLRIARMGVAGAVPRGSWAVARLMVTTEDARWLAGYLRKMVASRPAAWANCELTLSQLIALHVIAARAPMTLLSLSEALGTRPPATCAMVNRLAKAGLVHRTPDPDRKSVV